MNILKREMRCARPFFALNGGIEKRSRQFARFFMGYGSIYTEHQFGKLVKKTPIFIMTVHMPRNASFTFEKIAFKIECIFWKLHGQRYISTPDSEVPKSK